MPMMTTYKSGFEPKDARTISIYDDDDDDFDDFDDWSLETTPPRPRRRKTGTQALVEFLNTTSPEEFRKIPPPKATHSTPISPSTQTPATKQRTSTPFFLRRRNKNKASSSSSILASNASTAGSSLTSVHNQGAPNTIHRKNYIEIIAHNPTRIPHYYEPLASAGTIQTLATGSKISLNEPVLPNRRESSLYSASIRSMSIKSPSSPYPKANTNPPALGSPAKESDGLDNNTMGDTKKNMVDTMVAACNGMDVIEAGLIQRLKQCQLYGIDRPMDVVASHLTDEHIRALKVSSSIAVAAGQGQAEQKQTKKKRSRHVQVQTLPWNDSFSFSTEMDINHKMTSSSAAATTITATEQEDLAVLEDLQRQLAQERQERQRLEAALETTCDHFEVLSGLAYKKLRELWEEKLRWETACIELNDRLANIGQVGNSGGPVGDLLTDDFQHSDFMVG